jgi:YfiH family protein
MSDSTLAEVPVAGTPGTPPRLEIPGWREQFGIVAGITCRRHPTPSEETEEWDFRLGGQDSFGSGLDRWKTLSTSEPGFKAVVASRQAHRTRIGVHRGTIRGIVILDGLDGHVTEQPGVLLAVTLADCIPVYLADPVRPAGAILHAGWRGVAAGILPAGIEALRNLGCDPKNMVMHCGVGICGACYEVGNEVLLASGKEPHPSGKGRLDLRALLVEQAQRAGVERLSTSPMCSAHQPEQFFSHRASRGRDGRMVGYLGLLDR